MIYFALLILVIISYLFYYIGKKRALNLKFNGNIKLSSQPDYFGYYVVLMALIPALLMWFGLLLFKGNFQEMFVMSPILFPDISTWSDGKLGLILNKLNNLSVIVNLPLDDLTNGEKSILNMASENELTAAKNLANFDKIYGWSNLTLFIILPIILGLSLIHISEPTRR